MFSVCLLSLNCTRSPNQRTSVKFQSRYPVKMPKLGLCKYKLLLYCVCYVTTFSCKHHANFRKILHLIQCICLHPKQIRNSRSRATKMFCSHTYNWRKWGCNSEHKKCHKMLQAKFCAWTAIIDSTKKGVGVGNLADKRDMRTVRK